MKFNAVQTGYCCSKRFTDLMKNIIKKNYIKQLQANESVRILRRNMSEKYSIQYDHNLYVRTHLTNHIVRISNNMRIIAKTQNISVLEFRDYLDQKTEKHLTATFK